MIPYLETHIQRNRGILDQAYLAFLLIICAVAIWYTPDVAGSPSPEVARHPSLRRRGSLGVRRRGRPGQAWWNQQHSIISS